MQYRFKANEIVKQSIAPATTITIDSGITANVYGINWVNFADRLALIDAPFSVITFNISGGMVFELFA